MKSRSYKSYDASEFTQKSTQLRKPLTQVTYAHWSYYGRNYLSMFISMHDSSYHEEEQYLIYDFNSFIADVGGYMGLLLGSSILSLFDEIESFLRTLLRSSRKLA